LTTQGDTDGVSGSTAFAMTRLDDALQLRREAQIPEAVAALRSILEDAEAEPREASQAALLLGDPLQQQADPVKPATSHHYY
jgi:hypothetical protein